MRACMLRLGRARVSFFEFVFLFAGGGEFAANGLADSASAMQVCIVRTVVGGGLGVKFVTARAGGGELTRIAHLPARYLTQSVNWQ